MQMFLGFPVRPRKGQNGSQIGPKWHDTATLNLMVAVPAPFGPQMAPIGHPLAPLRHPLGTHWHPFGTHGGRANVTTKLVPFGGDVGRQDLVGH